MADKPWRAATTATSTDQWRDDDYDVICNGAVVGRVFLSPAAQQDPPWASGRERLLIALNFGSEPIAASLASDESPGRLLVSSAGDREGEPVRGSVQLRAHEGAVVELSLGR